MPPAPGESTFGTLDQSVLDKVIELANQLGATVAGEEGETYWARNTEPGRTTQVQHEPSGSRLQREFPESFSLKFGHRMQLRERSITVPRISAIGN